MSTTSHPGPSRPAYRCPRWFRAAVRDAIARGTLRPQHQHGDAVDQCRAAGFADLLVAAGMIATPEGAVLVSEPLRSTLTVAQAWRRAAELGQALGCTAWIEPRAWQDRRNHYRVCFAPLQPANPDAAPKPQRIAQQPPRGKRGRSHTKQPQAVTGDSRGPGEGGQDGRPAYPSPAGSGPVRGHPPLSRFCKPRPCTTRHQPTFRNWS